MTPAFFILIAALISNTIFAAPHLPNIPEGKAVQKFASSSRAKIDGGVSEGQARLNSQKTRSGDESAGKAKAAAPPITRRVCIRIAHDAARNL
jgi:hypothetical protein